MSDWVSMCILFHFWKVLGSARLIHCSRCKVYVCIIIRTPKQIIYRFRKQRIGGIVCWSNQTRIIQMTRFIRNVRAHNWTKQKSIPDLITSEIKDSISGWSLDIRPLYDCVPLETADFHAILMVTEEGSKLSNFDPSDQYVVVPYFHSNEGNCIICYHFQCERERVTWKKEGPLPRFVRKVLCFSVQFFWKIPFKCFITIKERTLMDTSMSGQSIWTNIR